MSIGLRPNSAYSSILVCFYIVSFRFLKTDCALCLTSLLNENPTFHDHITELEGLYYQRNEAEDLKVP